MAEMNDIVKLAVDGFKGTVEKYSMREGSIINSFSAACIACINLSVASSPLLLTRSIRFFNASSYVAVLHCGSFINSSIMPLWYSSIYNSMPSLALRLILLISSNTSVSPAFNSFFSLHHSGRSSVVPVYASQYNSAVGYLLSMFLFCRSMLCVGVETLQ